MFSCFSHFISEFAVILLSFLQKEQLARGVSSRFLTLSMVIIYFK